MEDTVGHKNHKTGMDTIKDWNILQTHPPKIL